MISLTFVGEHYSITPKTDPVSISNFTILTGVNGSGKSQLLEAIANSNIRCEIDGNAVSEIQLLTSEDLIPSEPKSVDKLLVEQVQAMLDQRITAYKHQPASKVQFRNFFQENGSYAGLPNRPFEGVFRESFSRGRVGLSKDEIHALLPEDYITNSFENDTFELSISEIFKSYKLELEQNELYELRNSKSKKKLYDVLTPHKFRERHGPAPWNMMNSILGYMSLPYKFTVPKDGSGMFKAQLKNTTKRDLIISTNQLSSGEKTLLSLGIALYRARRNQKFPELLLLDEPDAHLHPSMSSILVKILSEEILALTKGIIITTHNPSTCAFAKSDSLYLMDKKASSPIKKSFEEVVSLLTAGLPLKISLNPSFQIITEDKFDTEIYSTIWTNLRPTIDPKNQFSDLQFLPASGLKKSGGCSEAVDLCEKMRASGVTTAFALLDYDFENVENQNTKVLGLGVGYSVENFILHPLMLAGGLIQRYMTEKLPENLSFLEGVSFSNFSGQKKPFYQKVTDEISKLLLSILSDLRTSHGVLKDFSKIDETESAMYLFDLENGFQINTPMWFLKAQGHQLEELVIDCFPGLRRFADDGGRNIGIDLMKIMSKDHTDLLSKEFSKVYGKFLENV